MKTQQQPQPENTISREVIQDAFAQSYSPAIGQLTFRKLNLEMQNQALQTRLADTEARAFGVEQQNANLIKAQIALEDENFGLKAEVIVQADRVQELEAELAEYRAYRKSVRMSPEVTEIAAEGSAIAAEAAAEAKEKAAPD